MPINIGSFVGGIVVGIITTLLIITCYYVIQRWVRRPRAVASPHSSRAHSRDLELGSVGSVGSSTHATYMPQKFEQQQQQQQQQAPYPGPLHPAHFSGGR